MSIAVDLQVSEDAGDVPSAEEFRHWVTAALADRRRRAQVSLRITGRDEMRDLNRRYRDRPGATNVLSFPADLPAEVRTPLLGDVVVCAPIVAEEARAQGKTELAHWAHLVVHGTLHLIGYDHVEAHDARRMEAVETDVLARLGYADPYRAA